AGQLGGRVEARDDRTYIGDPVMFGVVAKGVVVGDELALPRGNSGNFLLVAAVQLVELGGVSIPIRLVDGGARRVGVDEATFDISALVFGVGGVGPDMGVAVGPLVGAFVPSEYGAAFRHDNPLPVEPACLDGIVEPLFEPDPVGHDHL